ncbi:hypothetical protein, partial [Escherichia coli]|uniref:hypothetical protein n=1 Tax=Escherichia coli TaxID=562 RepID=UPI001C57EDBF
MECDLQPLVSLFCEDSWNSDFKTNIVLFVKVDCYAYIDGVTTLPCIEVFTRQIRITFAAKGLIPFFSFGVYDFVDDKGATLCQSSVTCNET